MFFCWLCLFQCFHADALTTFHLLFVKKMASETQFVKKGNGKFARWSSDERAPLLTRSISSSPNLASSAVSSLSSKNFQHNSSGRKGRKIEVVINAATHANNNSTGASIFRSFSANYDIWRWVMLLEVATMPSFGKL